MEESIDQAINIVFQPDVDISLKQQAFMESITITIILIKNRHWLFVIK